MVPGLSYNNRHSTVTQDIANNVLKYTFNVFKSIFVISSTKSYFCETCCNATICGNLLELKCHILYAVANVCEDLLINEIVQVDFNHVMT